MKLKSKNNINSTKSSGDLASNDGLNEDGRAIPGGRYGCA